MPLNSKDLSEANRIKKLRKALRLSQRELAKAFGVSPGAVAHWESGERHISGPVLKLVEIYEAKAEKAKLSKKLWQTVSDVEV